MFAWFRKRKLEKLKPKLTEIEYYQELERQKAEAADAAMAEIEPTREAVAAEQVNFHKQDCDEFALKCERTADFMTLEITRLGRASPSVIDQDRRPVRPVTTTERINLSLVTNIDIWRGKEPAHEAPVDMFINYETPSGVSYSSVPLHLSSDGEIMCAHVHGGFTPYPRAAWSQPSDRTDSCAGGSSNSFTSAHKFPHPADDDVIHFRGLGASINCPFGKGDEVVAKLMEAIGNAKQ